MSQWTIGKRIACGFIAVLMTLLALGAFSVYKLSAIQSASHVVVHDCLPGMYLSGQIELFVKDNYAHTTKHIIALDAAAKAQVENDMKETREKITAVVNAYEKTITKAEDRQLFDAMVPLRKKFLEIRDNTVLPLSREGKSAEAMAAVREKLDPAYAAFLESARAVVKFNKAHGEAAGNIISAEISESRTGIFISVIVAMLLGSAIAFVIARGVARVLSDVVSSLSQAAEQVASSSVQVAGASQALASGASEQASSLEETSASLEEMSSMIRQNADHADEARRIAGDSAQAAQTGRGSMSRMSEAIQRIKNSSDQTAKILKTIDEIAFQTNLLALNAAVEAARAGEAGKGFAVVAEEVRNLAQRSAEAARNTANLIGESQKNADDGVKVSEEVAASLMHIAGTSGKLSQLISDVAEANKEQSRGIEQITTAVTQMDKVTQSNAASAEESSSASEELSAQAREMESSVETLIHLVGGQSNRAQSEKARTVLAPTGKPARAPQPKVDAARVVRAASKSTIQTRVAPKSADRVQTLSAEDFKDCDF